MILTDYYKGEKLTKAKSRFDVTASTGEYENFERVLTNKRGFNTLGLSFNCISRPDRWKKKKADLALAKGSNNITSVLRPNPENNLGYGDIKDTSDGCIIIFNRDFKEKGITTIEIFIARGLRNDKTNLWELFQDGELDNEIDVLRGKAVTKNVTKPE